MSKICRTCLERTDITYKTSHELFNFGEGSIRISAVLRFCIPELYLGLSPNPEICIVCKENLKVSYLFKKKCLDTEAKIGNFLKNVRCTGKSVELHHVLAFINHGHIPPGLLREVTLPCNVVAEQKAISELKDPPESKTKGNENPPVTDKQPTAHKPKVYKARITNLPDLQNVIVSVAPPSFNNSLQNSPQTTDITQTKLPDLQNVIMTIAPSFNNSIQNSHQTTNDITQTNLLDLQNVIVSVAPSFNNTLQYSPSTTNDITQTNLQDKDDTDSFCKISSVFSLNDSVKNLNIINFDGTAAASTAKEELVDIKYEPLDMDLNDNFKSIAQDEDTLDASETKFYDKESDSSLQDIISSIPEINHPDQYVDIPDFVTINNFGFKELEEYKLQQSGQAAPEPAKEMSEVTINSDDLDKTDNTQDASVSVNGNEMKVVKVLANAPDVIIFNGKRMVKCGNQYRMEEDLPKLEGSGVPAQAPAPTSVPTPEVEMKSPLPSNRKRARRKIKIVPVGDQPPEKSVKMDSNPPVFPPVPHKPPKTDDKDIVVLFTNYTSGGDYVNDHDYLISPYKRNKVLIEEHSQWLCMCFICNTKHAVWDHVQHMNTHRPFCEVCSADLGTPFMLNLHCRAHKRPCRYCTEVVPHGLLRSHEAKHAAEEKEIVRGSKKNPYHVRKGRRRYKEDEKPVYFPLPRQGGKDSEGGEGSRTETAPVPVIPDVGNATGPGEDTGTAKKRKGRRRRLVPPDKETVDSPRALRTRVKKWYVESEEEDERSKEGTSGDKGAEADPNTLECRKRQNWDDENMRMAVEAVRQERMCYKVAAKKFGVALAALYRTSRTGKTGVPRTGMGRKQALPAALEDELVACVRKMERTYFGLTQQDLRRMAFQLARRHNLHHTFSLLQETAGYIWTSGFLDRHENVLKTPNCCFKENVAKFFDLLEDVMEKAEYPPHRIYNVDVTGLYIVRGPSPHVVAVREKPLPSLASDSSAVFVLCMSASGHFVPPMILFPRNVPGEEFKRGAPPGSVFAYHPVAWMQMHLFTEWFDHFLRHVNPTEDSPALLLINGQHVHTRNLDFFLKAGENSVTVVCVPPYGTQKLQPLDRTVMVALKNHYDEEVKRFTAVKDRDVTHFDVCQLFGNAYSRIESEETAIRGFREAGICPVDRGVISDGGVAGTGRSDVKTEPEMLDDGKRGRSEVRASTPTEGESKPVLGQTREVMTYEEVAGPSRTSKVRNESEERRGWDSESDESEDDVPLNALISKELQRRQNEITHTSLDQINPDTPERYF